jgi:hypothetical protein
MLRRIASSGAPFIKVPDGPFLTAHSIGTFPTQVTVLLCTPLLAEPIPARKQPLKAKKSPPENAGKKDKTEGDYLWT